MLKFNTYRPNRYLRSRFVEGKFLLASEGSDLQLESLQTLRDTIKKSLGSAFAIDNAWQVEVFSSTQLLIKPGDAWVEGIPFPMRSGNDQLVSGAILTLGIIPVGVTITDAPNGAGKLLSFNDGATTPTNLYRIVVSAQEELITDVEDPFLKNVNLTESTAQKVRIIYRINIVPDSLQSSSPQPYRDENSTASLATNFPNTGGLASPNLANEVIITPAANLNGEVLSITPVTGSEGIDGKDLEIVIRNNTAVGSGIVLPNSPLGWQAFANSTLVDSNGNQYHVNAIFNDTVNTQLVIVIDKEVGQPNPVITNGSPYKLIKRDIYVTDDVNGSPQGRRYWPIAKVQWNSSDEFIHQSIVEDLRATVTPTEFYQKIVNQKQDLRLVGGGVLNWNLSRQVFTWSQDFELINPYGPNQVIPNDALPLVDGGALVYELDLAGGSIVKGIQSVNVTSFGVTSTLSAVDLSSVKVGNIIIDSNGTVAEITAINDVSNQITTNVALTSNGSATIYLDSYGPETAKLTNNGYVLAVRYGNKIYVGNNTTLADGENFQLAGASSEFDRLLGRLKLYNHETASNKVRIASGKALLLDNAELNQVANSFLLDFEGAVINFTTGTVLKSDDSTPLGNNFTPFSVPLGQYFWYGISLLPDNVTALNTQEALVQVEPATASNSNPSLAPKPNLSGDIKLGAIQVLNNGGNIEVVNIIRLGVGAGSGGGSGRLVKADYLDPISTSLPTGPTVTIDGQAGANGDLVLFTNLSTNNNRIYKLDGVGSSITWTAVRAFGSSLDPDDADTVRIKRGNSFSDQLAVFDGTNFKVNDVVRFFDGVSADYWELSSIKTVDLLDNTTDEVFSVNLAGSENFTVEYSILRAGSKRTGQLFITSDGTIANITDTSAYIGDVGVVFNATVTSGVLALEYSTTNTGSDAVMKFFTKRWSDSPGGPGGVPNYSGASSSTPAGGSNTQVQFNSGGLLAGDSNFTWLAGDTALSLNGLQIRALSGSITINDNQTTPDTAFQYSATNFRYAIVEYSITRDGNFRVGRLLIANDGAVTADSDDFVETNPTGVLFSSTISAGQVLVQYTSTNTGFTGTLKYSIRRWN
jgi:hypothetical protein